jgi:dihydrofolate reductase
MSAGCPAGRPRSNITKEPIMRKVIAAAFVSLDGVVQAPGGPEEDPTQGFRFGGWTFPFWSQNDPAMNEAMGALFGTPYDLLLGRKTYEIFAAHWPFIKDDPIADGFNKTRKYVATRSHEPLTWDNSVALDDAAAEVAKLKQQDGPVLLIQGSSNLIQTLLRAGLIDEFRLMIFPVLLGKGKKLFGEGTQPQALQLVESRVAKSGVTLNTYHPAGAVRTGSFAMSAPSQAELARREKMKQEG